MQIKPADSRQPDVLALERLLDRPDAPAATRKRIEAEIRQIQAGERAEQAAAYQIELYFGRSEHWASIHDLRIEVDGLAAQMDHVLINRLAEVWVCESKSFAEGVSINDHGEWVRWWNGRSEGIPSPIEQNHRHIHLLQRAFDDGLAPRPRRFGLAPMKPRLKSLVLVSDSAKINRPRKRVDGLEEVIKAEQLKTRLFDAFDATPDWDVLRLIGKDGLEKFARGLAALHRPTSFDWAGRFGLADMPEGSSTMPRTAPQLTPLSLPRPRSEQRPWLVKYDGPCSRCGRTLARGTVAVWDQAARKMHCVECPA
jgi:nuclease-like protein